MTLTKDWQAGRYTARPTNSTPKDQTGFLVLLGVDMNQIYTPYTF